MSQKEPVLEHYPDGQLKRDWKSHKNGNQKSLRRYQENGELKYEQHFDMNGVEKELEVKAWQ